MYHITAQNAPYPLQSVMQTDDYDEAMEIINSMIKGFNAEGYITISNTKYFKQLRIVHLLKEGHSILINCTWQM